MTGRPAARRAVSARMAYCSSSVGGSSRSRNISSVRKRPIPSAPFSKADCASSTVPTFAPTSILRPSAATPRAVRNLSSRRAAAARTSFCPS